MKGKQQDQLGTDAKNSNLETPVIPHLSDLIPSTPGTRSAKWDWDQASFSDPGGGVRPGPTQRGGGSPRGGHRP